MTDKIQDMVAEIPALRRYGRVLTGSPSGADDLVQDTLERAIQKFHLYRQGTKLRLWLFTIMRNLFLDRYRKQRKMSAIVSELTHRQLDHRTPDQLDKLIHKDLVKQLNGLKREYRDLLMLVGVQGLSYEQAAEATGVPLGTVRSRLFRARNLLSQRIEGAEQASRPGHARDLTRLAA
jgi:RNA polymerase sigma-70 factor (ECF subfamily)